MSRACLVWVVSLAAGANGCATDPLVCTAEFAAVTAAVVNRTGQAFPGLNVGDTVLRTGSVLDLSGDHPSGDLPAEGVATVVIFSDAFQDAIRPAGETVVVVVTAGDHTLSARYEFATDGCHVRKVSGPDTLAVETAG